MNLELKLNDAAGIERLPAIDIRYGQVGLVQVRIRTADPGTILDELTGRVATAPHFFQRTGVCLDLSALATSPNAGELRAVMDAVRRAGMIAIGLAGGAPGVEELSLALDVPVLSGLRAPNQAVPVLRAAGAAPVDAPPAVSAIADAPAAAAAPDAQPQDATEATDASAPGTQAPADSQAAALLHTQPVRSGQRLYARRRDLVVMATVGAGAEVMADGCVHVYSALRGRAMAGARGDTAARVFCQEFRAELVSIAGVFRVFETIPPALAGRPVQAWLDGEDLRFAPIRD